MQAPEEEEEEEAAVEAPAEEEEEEAPAEEEEEEEEEEEDIVDPHDTMKASCTGTDKCSKLKAVLDECTDRVNSKSNTSESCYEEVIDLIQCVDHCLMDRNFLKVLK